MISRRDVLVASAATGLAMSLPKASVAETYPDRPITIVVPYPPGGTVSAMARLITERVGAAIKGTFVIEHKGGAAGAVGTAAVARAAPDGYTLVLGTQQTHATNMVLIRNLSYDPARDFVPVAQLGALQHVLVTRKDLGRRDLNAFLALAQSKSDGLIYGSTGVGSASHFIAELFRKQAKIPALLHVPFRGSAPLVQELIGGRVDFAMATVAGVIGQVEAGNIIALGTASEKRSPNLAELPTFGELGIQGVAADAWFTLFAPSGTPSHVVALLENAIARELRQEQVRRLVVEQGAIPEFKAGADVARDLPIEIRRWAEIAGSAGIKID